MTSIDLALVPRRSARRDGLAVAVPIVAGNLPFALVVGAALAEQHGGAVGRAGSFLVYGGGAQLAALQPFGTSGAVLAVGLAFGAQLRVDVLVVVALLCVIGLVGPRLRRPTDRGVILVAAAMAALTARHLPPSATIALAAGLLP